MKERFQSGLDRIPTLFTVPNNQTKCSPLKFTHTSGKCYVNSSAEMTQIDTLKASRPRHNFPLAAKTKTKRKTIQTHAFSRQISSQTLSLLAILVEVPDVEKNSQEDTFIPPPLTRIFLSLWPGQDSSPILLCPLRKDP